MFICSSRGATEGRPRSRGGQGGETPSLLGPQPVQRIWPRASSVNAAALIGPPESLGSAERECESLTAAAAQPRRRRGCRHEESESCERHARGSQAKVGAKRFERVLSVFTIGGPGRDRGPECQEESQGSYLVRVGRGVEAVGGGANRDHDALLWPIWRTSRVRLSCASALRPRVNVRENTAHGVPFSARRAPAGRANLARWKRTNRTTARSSPGTPESAAKHCRECSAPRCRRTRSNRLRVQRHAAQICRDGAVAEREHAGRSMVRGIGTDAGNPSPIPSNVNNGGMPTPITPNGGAGTHTPAASNISATDAPAGPATWSP